MATYKVIQDIEAEDKLIGWMTPRQAIYAAIVVVSGFISFLLMTKGAWWVGLIFLPHMILFAVLAGPFVHDQPSEVWLLAKIRFALKPRRRIWNQSGISELVTINVPKKIEQRLTDGLSQTEVKSRLQALANTIDSRGWAVKNINVNMFAQPGYAAAETDRLIDPAAMPQPVVDYDVTAQDDILDEQSNPTAQHLDRMIAQSAEARRQEVVTRMQNPSTASAPSQKWFLDNNSGASTQLPKPARPSATKDRPAAKHAVKKSHAKKTHGTNRSTANMRTVQPLTEATPVKPPQNEAVRQLAQNDDWTVATIQRQANKENDASDDNEVVISLR